MATAQKQRTSSSKTRSTQKNQRRPVKRRRRRSRAGFRPSGLLLLVVLFLLVVGIGGNLSKSSGDKTNYNIADRNVSTETNHASLAATETEGVQSSLSLEHPTEVSVVTASPTPTAEPTSAPTTTPSPEPTPEPTVAPEQTDLTTHTIHVGDKGEDVLALQRFLAALGYLNKSDADGIFGNKTKNALIEYQNAAGLTATGVCDYNTYLSLTSSSAPAKAQPAGGSSGGGGGPTVYVTRTGEKYHYAGCQYIKGKNDLRQMTKSEAINSGYTACSKCG